MACRIYYLVNNNIRKWESNFISKRLILELHSRLTSVSFLIEVMRSGLS